MKNRIILKALSGVIISALLLSFTSLCFAQGTQTAISVKTSIAGAATGAWLHLPDDYSSTTEKYPLIIFFHGIGEKGTDLSKVLANGLPKIIARGAKMNFTVGGKLYKFIVVSPQIYGGYANETMVQAILDDVKAKYRVDASRVYLTGLSAGSYAAWNYVAAGKQYADNIAAIVPVSTAYLGPELVKNFCNTVVAGNVPVWQISGASDEPYRTQMLEYEKQYNSCNPAVKAISTIVAGGGHNSVTWDNAYDATHAYNNPNIYEWMLRYSKGTTAPPPAEPLAPVANAGPQVNVTLPTTTAVLDGSASKPATTAISSYEWKKTAGPDQFSLTGSTTAKASVANLVAGTYTFELKVTDVNGISSTAQTQVSVAPAVTPNPCNCTINITPTSGTTIDGATLKAQPGDTVCVAAGNYVSLMFTNFIGTPEKPIVFINCGGQVKVGNNGNYGIGFVNSQYFRITGTGSTDKYGFVVDGSAKPLQTGMAVGKRCTDYEVDHIELGHVGVGMFAKINPDCDPINQDPGFVIRNVSLHDLYVHDTEVEGLYVGNTSPNGTVIDCNGQQVTVFPPRIRNVKIFNVITKNTGWDGIQVSTAPEGVEIYNNDVSNYGTAKAYGQNAGILLGGSASGVVYNNRVNNGAGPCLMVFGIGLIKIYNNVLNGAGSNPIDPNMDDGIFIDDRKNLFPDKPLQVYAFNNTIINASRNGIKFLTTYNTVAKGNLFYNNLIVAAGTADIYGDRAYLNVQGGIDYQASNNLFIKNTADAKFVNAGGFNFNLLAGAPAIDAGRDVSAFGVTRDIDNEARPYGAAFDIGADELATGVAPNKPPVANAGSDVTVTLPVASVQLSGAASKDEDGTIASYTWTKVSGPAATIATPGTVNTSVTGLTAGVYIFELTVKDDKGLTAADRVTVTVNAANKAPVANAGADVNITLPEASVQLSGNTSSDEDGTIASYAWTKVSGPAATIATPGSVNTTVTGLTEGIYIFELTVKDDKGTTATDRVTVTVVKANPANKHPVPNAGVDLNITLPNASVQLTGSASYDEDGSIVYYAWTKISGPAATIATPSSANTTVSGLTEGVYVFELTIQDDKGLGAADRVTVTVQKANPVNKHPLANAGADITITLPVSSVQLTGSASTDEDGSIVYYAWTKVSGPAATIATPSSANTTVSGLTEGVYIFDLTIQDDKGLGAADRVTVTVLKANPPNKPPVANAGADVTITLPVSSVQLSGSASTDEDGSLAYYAWTKVSGPAATIATPSSANTTISGLSEGIYIFELTVQDDKGAGAADRVTVTVLKGAEPANLPPVADAGRDQTINLNEEELLLNGSGSRDPDGTIAKYEWRQLSGPILVGMQSPASIQTSISGATAGDYIFELTVTDNKGATASAQVRITVMKGAPGAAVAVSLFPNPVASDLHVRVNMEGKDVKNINLFVINMAGQIKKHLQLGANPSIQTQVDVSDLDNGIYIIRLTDGQSLDFVKKIMKAGN